MKQLKCEMCGSTDIIKQDGVFVCQVCGCKYSLEEARKMMIEGTVDVSGSTVKVDTAEELDNLYVLARRARDEGDHKTAAEYYGMILIKAPNDLEAMIYAPICKAYCDPYVKYADVHRSMCYLISLMGQRIKNDNDLTKAILNIALAYHHFLVDKYGGYGVNRLGHREDWEITNNLNAAGDLIDSLSENNDQLHFIAVQLWKESLKMYQDATLHHGDEASSSLIEIRYKQTVENYINKIQKYCPVDGIKTELDAPRLYEQAAKIMHSDAPDRYEKALNILKTIPPYWKSTPDLIFECEYEIRKQKENSSQKSGCYIATAIYGSYDCPQVWTLRRYRDSVLAKTVFGRMFIYIYYAVSPMLVNYFGGLVCVKRLWKDWLDRIVTHLQNSGIESTPYNDVEWE